MTDRPSSADRPDDEPGAAPTGPDAPRATGAGPSDREPAARDASADAPTDLFTEEQVRRRLAEQEAELQERYLRLAAEYQNFRRRVEREKEAWADDALEGFARDLLPVLDSFERALAVRETDPAAAVSGLELVDRQLRTALEKRGMTAVDASGAFDPRVHEAVLRSASPDKPAGAILRVLEQGWKMRSRLLRPARVQVSSGKE